MAANSNNEPGLAKASHGSVVTLPAVLRVSFDDSLQVTPAQRTLSRLGESGEWL